MASIEKELELEIPLNGGVDTVSLDDAIALPQLSRSLNTRLSALPGVPIKAPGETIIYTDPSPFEPTAVVPCGTEDATIVYRPNGQVVHSGGLSGPVRATAGLATRAQNMFRPAEVLDAGAIFSGLVNGPPAVLTVNGTGYTYYAACISDPATGQLDVYVIVTEPDPTDATQVRLKVAQTRVAQTLISTVGDFFAPAFVGLTKHSVNGVFVWYADNGGNINCRKLTVTGVNAMTIGSETTVYAVSNDLKNIAVCNSGGDNDDGDAYVWLLSKKFGADTTVQISRRNVTNFAGTAGDNFDIDTGIVGGSTNGIYIKLAISEYRSGSTSLLAVQWTSTSTGDGKLYSLDGTAGTWTLVGTQRWVSTIYSSPGTSFPILGAVGFLNDMDSGTVKVVGMWSAVENAVGTNDRSINLFARDAVTGSNTVSGAIRHSRLASRAATATLTASGSRIIEPYFLFSARTGTTDQLDPAVHVGTLGIKDGAFYHTPIARLGVDTATVWSLWSFGASDQISVTDLGDICLSYTAIRDGRWTTEFGEAKYAARQASLRRTGAFRHAIDDAGVAMIANAYPAYWDGVETAEMGPTWLPVMTGDVTGGSGPTLTGTYSYRAIIRWIDAQGQQHRSAPSLPITLSPAAQKPILYVSFPPTFKTGSTQQLYECIVYSTQDGLTTFYRLNIEPTAVSPAFVFGWVDEPTGSLVSVYSDGSGELLPQMPNALYDIAIVGNRAWGIDAEDRSVVWPSKMKKSGLAHEFNGALKIRFPADAGRLFWVSELDGNPVFGSETGIYTIYGSGPDNFGRGTAFSEPRRISELPCQRKLGAIRCANGVLFATGDRMALLASGGQVKRYNVAPFTSFIGAFSMRTTREAVFVQDTNTLSQWLVYNCDADAWTIWAYTGLAFRALSWIPGRNRIIAPTNSNTYEIVPTIYASNAPVEFVTGYIKPAGEQGDCTVRMVVLEAIYASGHDVTIAVNTDYGGLSQTCTRTWTASELADLIDADSRYTVAVNLNNQNCRKVRIRVTEENATSLAMVPLSLTIMHGVDPKVKRRAIRNGGVK